MCKAFRSKRYGLLLLIASFGLLATIGGFTPIPLARAASSSDKPMLRIGVFPALRPLELARGAHLLEKMGYKVDWINFPKYAPAEAEAAAAGAIDFAEADTSGLEVMDSKSPGLYWYIANGTSNYVAIVAKAGSGIHSLQDLKGKRVGGYIPDTAAAAVFDMGIGKAGIKLSEMQTLNIVGPTQAPAMQRNAMQATVSWVPWDSQMLLDGEATLVTTASRIYGTTWPGGGVVVRPEFAKAHKQAVIDVTKAVIEAQKLLRDHPELAYRTLARVIHVNVANVKYSYQHDLVGQINPVPNKEALTKQVSVIEKYGVMHVPNVSVFINQFIHPEFIQEAKQQMNE